MVLHAAESDGVGGKDSGDSVGGVRFPALVALSSAQFGASAATEDAVDPTELLDLFLSSRVFSLKPPGAAPLEDELALVPRLPSA